MKEIVYIDMIVKNENNKVGRFTLVTTHLLHTSKTDVANPYKHWDFPHVYYRVGMMPAENYIPSLNTNDPFLTNVIIL